jgi:eukaryotic-like serine/threonine-protein kinase
MAPPSPTTPSTIGPYRLLQRLGAGGMAEVWLAVAHGASGFEKRVALKVLLPELRENPRLLRLLIEEARLGARLQHRNLVQVHDLAVADGTYFLRLDYVDGADLRRLLERTRLAPELALLIVEEVVLALQYLHAACDEQGRPLGLVHRDVSPGNVLLSRAGEVKLSDLGVTKATLLADVTQANVLKGKYAYMSPEQIAGEPLGSRSDQFGLGVTLMELLCGRRPFDGATPLETMERVRAAEPPALDGVAPDLQAVLWRCLARDPALRFPDDEALRRTIAACRAARPPAAPVELGAWVRATLDAPAVPA